MKIHETAIVSKKAQLGKNIEIGPWCVIEDGVVIGDNTRLWQNVYVAGGTIIGKDNIIHMGAVIGHEPQHLQYKGEKTGTRIGDANIIREYVTIHRSFKEGGITVIGNKNYLMAASHVGHDSKLGNEIVMCNNVLLGGHTEVEDKVFMGGGAASHQFSRIGTMAMIGGLTRVVQDVVPYTLLECDAEVCGLNLVGLRRSGISVEARKQIKEAYKIIYHLGLSIPTAIKEIRKIPDPAKEILHMADFMEKTKKGICRRRQKNRSLALE
ncbi:MAG: acyl-ACP--UDP-N-acetylglucosamine O-acyltransferase [Candidatus Omnitrophica bacterium]|nr:acyl-ACP--UDP-N-acetylglucosamine O-acyltransferase [Candidatus Omnitrophota bacterium]